MNCKPLLPGCTPSAPAAPSRNRKGPRDSLNCKPTAPELSTPPTDSNAYFKLQIRHIPSLHWSTLSQLSAHGEALRSFPLSTVNHAKPPFHPLQSKSLRPSKMHRHATTGASARRVPMRLSSEPASPPSRPEGRAERWSKILCELIFIERPRRILRPSLARRPYVPLKWPSKCTMPKRPL